MAAPRAAILGCAGLDLAPAERAFFADADPWGFILFARNVDAPDRLSALCADLRDAVGRAAPILIDQEGGRVQRLGPSHWRAWQDAGAMLTRVAPDQRETAMRLRHRLIAEELRAVGVDVNCAPVLDLALPEGDPVIGARAYSADPAEVARLGRAAREGLEAGGVRPVIKHIPGHGRAPADSHVALPRVETDRETLDATDFASFRAHADAALAMTAHVVYAAIDPERPATVSPAAIRVIREEIGFNGLLMTDDVSMAALEGAMEHRCAAALAAGCDVVLHCDGDRAAMEAVCAAAPRLEGRALVRAEAAARPLAAAPFDAEAALRRLDALCGRADA